MQLGYARNVPEEREGRGRGLVDATDQVRPKWNELREVMDEFFESQVAYGQLQ